MYHTCFFFFSLIYSFTNNFHLYVDTHFQYLEAWISEWVCVKWGARLLSTCMQNCALMVVHTVCSMSCDTEKSQWHTKAASWPGKRPAGMISCWPYWLNWITVPQTTSGLESADQKHLISFKRKFSLSITNKIAEVFYFQIMIAVLVLFTFLFWGEAVCLHVYSRPTMIMSIIIQIQ